MLFFPYNTDAPIYYWPYGTVGLIVLNVLIFAASMANPQVAEWAYGNGILMYSEFNPWAWVMSNFLHADLMHLLGNMLFLWGFGLVVEGKLGWAKFVPLYLGIGIAQSMLQQSLMFWSDSGSLGASSAIFGLMAITAIWAPKNNYSCFFWFFRFATTFDMPIYLFCMVYTMLQFVFMGWGVFATGDAGAMFDSEFLHLCGMFVAAPVGVAFVKFEWVDCEGWDAFSVFKGTDTPKLASERLAEAHKKLEQSSTERSAEPKPLATLQQMLADGLHDPAIKLWRKHGGPRGSAWELPEPDHKRLAQSALAAKEWEAAMLLLPGWIDRGFDGQTSVRVTWAELLCKVADRPAKALHVLEPVEASALPEKLRQRYLRVRQYAQRMIDEGHLEVALDE